MCDIIKLPKNSLFSLWLTQFQLSVNIPVNSKHLFPKTMQSKLVSGLYFAGEIMDVDAYTGGFNLQIAFSTAYVAGNSI